MELALSGLLIALVAILFFSNIYFRIKLIRIFKKMKNSAVSFEFRDLYFRKKREVLLAKHPEHRQDIGKFAKILKQYTRLTIILIAAIVVVAVVVLTTN